MQGSGSAGAPNVVFHLDLTGKSSVTFGFNAKDLDAPSLDNAIQQVAVQYRVGGTGAYTNLPSGYIADATTLRPPATQVTAKSVALPGRRHNQASVFVRVITTDAVGSDDPSVRRRQIAPRPAPRPLIVRTPAARGPPSEPAISHSSPGRRRAAPPPYTGGVHRTCRTASPWPPTADRSPVPRPRRSVSTSPDLGDGRAARTDSDSFTWTVTAPEVPIAIAADPGHRRDHAVDARRVTTEGVVTAAYPTGGLNGFYIQTPGPDTTPNASDGLFVYGGTAASRPTRPSATPSR